MQAKQIVRMASIIAKGGERGMLGLAGEWLNTVLNNLKLVYNLKSNRVTIPLTIPPGSSPGGGFGPFPVPGSYLRTYDLFYMMPSAGGLPPPTQPIFLNMVTMQQFDAEVKTQIANYPYEAATDLSTQAQVWSGGSVGLGTKTQAGNLYIYPASSGTLELTWRYMLDQPDIVSPENSTQQPWFAHDQYLIEATAAGMMGVTGDNRKAEYEQRSLDMLRPYLIQEGDEQRAVVSIQLDPRRFHYHQGLKPTKAFPF
jgi:hypothetical protein